MESSDVVEFVGEEEREQPKPFAKFRLRPAHLLWLLIPLLLWWSLRNVPAAEILRTLENLRAWQLGVLLFINVAILGLFGLRWWLVIRLMGRAVPFLRVLAYRVAGFGVSYFTPGPQVGGEPVQVLLLTRKHGIPAAQAISSVFLDKLLELLANFTFLVVGLIVIVSSNLFSGWLRVWMWPLAGVVLAFPAAHLAALWRGKLPVTWLAGWVLRRRPGRAWLVKTEHFIRQAEGQIGELCKNHPAFLLLLIALSGLTWLVLVIEYLLTLSYLGIVMTLGQSIIALTLARIAFLFPLPGGLGALEASQVLAMQMLGFSPALGISLTLVIRARDILSGVVGLALGGWAARK